MNIKEKISKLLALADSPNENEAKAALLKARQLMAKHKLSECDIQRDKSTNIIKKSTGVSFTKMSNVWVSELGAIIAENYCCKSFIRHREGDKKREIGFIGLEDDFNVCESVFNFAYDFIINRCCDIKKENKDIYTAKCIREMCNFYGRGFVIGLGEMFEKQNKSEETGLILVIPKEVTESISDMDVDQKNYMDIKSHHYESLKLQAQGYNDGLEFRPNQMIE